MERASITMGMLVRGPGGRRLGSVLACTPDRLLIRRRLPFAHTPIGWAPLSAVRSLARGTVHLSEPMIRADPPARPWMTVLPVSATAFRRQTEGGLTGERAFPAPRARGE